MEHEAGMDEALLPLAKRIKAGRAVLGLGQRDFAKLVGVSPGEIGRVEAGFRQPSIDVLKRLARALDIEFGELYELAGYPAMSREPLPFYLRRRYGLPGEATEEIEEYFRSLQAKYGSTKGADDDSN